VLELTWDIVDRRGPHLLQGPEAGTCRVVAEVQPGDQRLGRLREMRPVQDEACLDWARR